MFAHVHVWLIITEKDCSLFYSSGIEESNQRILFFTLRDHKNEISSSSTKPLEPND